MFNNYILNSGADNGKISVVINRKKIKNARLKVHRDLTVSLNLPCGVPKKWIIDFLESHKNWIDTQITKRKKAIEYNNLRGPKSGFAQILGREMRIVKIKADIKRAKFFLDENTVIVYLKDLNGFDKAFQGWLRKLAHEIFANETLVLYNDIFEKYNIAFPLLRVRKMKSLWGSCAKTKNKIVINEYLIKADIQCIQYVILHELTHLLYIKHNADFYNFLSIYMPDWKQRKNLLKKQDCFLP